MKTNQGSLPHKIQCKDAIHFIQEVHKLGRRGWAYRGQSVPAGSTLTAPKERPLKSSLCRFLELHLSSANDRLENDLIRRDWWSRREARILERFRRSARLFLRNPPPDDGEADLEWTALMQHYGAPTRLLDITFNPMVALFFAIENWLCDLAEIQVHAFHLDSIRSTTRKLCNFGEGELSPAAYRIGKDHPKTDFVGVYEGNLPSDRHVAQEGAFLIPSRIDLDIGEWLDQHRPDKTPDPYGHHWIKFTLPVGSKRALRDIVKQMMNMGVGPERLFPGIEGLAQSLKFAWLDVPK